MISKSTIDKIIDTSRIDEVVVDFVPLKKRGVNLIALCPFHNEKTPSFTVSPSKGIYKCFGCGAGGNSLNFIMEHEKYSYPEALKYLAKKYSIDIEEQEYTPEDKEKLNDRESLYVVNSYAQKNFTNTLHNAEEGKAIGLSYFKERGFTEETIEKFQLGYCLDNKDSFTRDALKNGYNLNFLEKSGLTIVKDDFNIDRFRGRVIFPIHNLSGRVIAFGGRILKKEAKAAKYINSPESDIYEKRNVLYGLHFAKKSIIAEDNCCLAEGYTDIISLNQAGIENVVASSGTSLTVEQIRLVKRYTKNISILFDGDPAGIKASLRGMDLILEEGMNVKVVLFPDGEDPDSFSKKVNDDELHSFIRNNAKDFIAFKTGLLLEETGDDPIKKTSLIRDIVETIAVIPDAIARSVYIQECSKALDISEQALINELNKARRKKFSEKRTRETVDHHISSTEQSIEQQPVDIEIREGCEYQERDIIRFLLKYGDHQLVFDDKGEGKSEVEGDEAADKQGIKVSVAEFMVNELMIDQIEFDNKMYQQIFDEFSKKFSKSELKLKQDAHFNEDDKNAIDEHYFLNHSNDEIRELAIDLIFSPYSLSKNWEERYGIYVHTEAMSLEKAVKRLIYSLKMEKVGKMIADVREKIKDASSEENTRELLDEHQQLLGLKTQISQHLGRVIV